MAFAMFIVLMACTAVLFPDPQKATDDFKSFAKVNEGRLYKLLKTCMDLQTDLKNLVKSTVSILKLAW